MRELPPRKPVCNPRRRPCHRSCEHILFGDRRAGKSASLVVQIHAPIDDTPNLSPFAVFRLEVRQITIHHRLGQRQLIPVHYLANPAPRCSDTRYTRPIRPHGSALSPARYSHAPLSEILGNCMRACGRSDGGQRCTRLWRYLQHQRRAAPRSPPHSHHQLALAHRGLAVIVEEIVVLVLVEVHVLVRLVVGAAAVVVDGALAASRARRRPSLSRRPESVNPLEVGRCGSLLNI